MRRQLCSSTEQMAQCESASLRKNFICKCVFVPLYSAARLRSFFSCDLIPIPSGARCCACTRFPPFKLTTIVIIIVRSNVCKYLLFYMFSKSRYRLFACTKDASVKSNELRNNKTSTIQPQRRTQEEKNVIFFVVQGIWPTSEAGKCSFTFQPALSHRPGSATGKRE